MNKEELEMFLLDLYNTKEPSLTEKGKQKIIKTIEDLQDRIDKAIEYLETLEKREAYKIEDNENGFPTLKVDNEEYLVICKYNKLLDILKGE